MNSKRRGLEMALCSGLLAFAALPRTAQAAGTFDVTLAPYSANTTGSTNDRAAIQRAIEDAYAAGGGTVLFPGGTAASPKVYLTGGLVLRSNVTLHISEFATLKQSPNTGDYLTTVGVGRYVDTSFPWNHYMYRNVPLLFAKNAHDIAIVGDGPGHLGKISMTNGPTDGTAEGDPAHSHTIWMQAVGMVNVQGARLFYLDFDGMNGVSTSFYNTSWGFIHTCTFEHPNTLNSGPIELENSDHMNFVFNTAIGMNDDAIALESLGDRDNPWCNSSNWCSGVQATPLHDITIAENNIQVSRSGSAIDWFPWGAAQGQMGIYNVVIGTNTFTSNSSGPSPSAALGCIGINPMRDSYSVNSEGQSPIWNVTFANNQYVGPITGLGSSHKYPFGDCIARDMTIDPSDGLAVSGYQPTRPRSVFNPGFETGNLNGWSVQGQDGQIAVTALAGQNGAFSARLAHYELGYAALWQGIQTTPGKSYTFKMRAKTSGAITRMLAYDTCAGQTFAWKTFNPTSWDNQSLTFTATSCPNIQVVVDTNTNQDPTAWAQIDDARVIGDYVDSESPAITYSGEWFGCTDPNSQMNVLCTNRDSRNIGYFQPYSHSLDAGVSASFEGTKAAIIVGTGVGGGIMNVFVDGVFQQTVDLYSATDQFARAIYTTPTLSSGTHTIQLINSHTTSHGGSDLYFDAIQVL